MPKEQLSIHRLDIAEFAKVIRFPSNGRTDEAWWAEHERKISKLPYQLRRDKNFVTRWLERRFANNAVLCHSHRKLNAPVVRYFFNKVVSECCHHLTPFLHHLPTERSARLWVERVASINFLWTRADLFHQTFSIGEPIHRYAENECEACILARIGGDRQMLTDIYIAIKSREGDSRGSAAKCNKLVESWLATHGILEETYQNTKHFYRHLKTERCRMQRERRAKRAQATSGTSTVSASREESVRAPPCRGPLAPIPERQENPVFSIEEGDVEEPTALDELIGFYRDSLMLPKQKRSLTQHGNDSRKSLHPAIAENLDYDAKSGKYSQYRPQAAQYPMPAISEVYQQASSQSTDYQRTGQTIRSQMKRSATSSSAISRDSRLGRSQSTHNHYRSDSPVSDDSRDDHEEGRQPPLHHPAPSEGPRRNSRTVSDRPHQGSRSVRDRPRKDSHPNYAPSATLHSPPRPREYSESIYSRLDPTSRASLLQETYSSPQPSFNDSGYDSSLLSTLSSPTHQARVQTYQNLVGTLPSSAHYSSVYRDDHKKEEPVSKSNVDEAAFKPDTPKLDDYLTAYLKDVADVKVNANEEEPANTSRSEPETQAATSQRCIPGGSKKKREKKWQLQTLVDQERLRISCASTRCTRWGDFYGLSEGQAEHSERGKEGEGGNGEEEVGKRMGGMDAAQFSELRRQISTKRW